MRLHGACFSREEHSTVCFLLCCKVERWLVNFSQKQRVSTDELRKQNIYIICASLFIVGDRLQQAVGAFSIHECFTKCVMNILKFRRKSHVRAPVHMM